MTEEAWQYEKSYGDEPLRGVLFGKTFEFLHSYSFLDTSRGTKMVWLYETSVGWLCEYMHEGSWVGTWLPEDLADLDERRAYSLMLYKTGVYGSQR